MDDLAALDQAVEEFRNRLVLVRDTDLSRPTPCSDWDVAALIEHANRGNRMAELLMHGADARTSVGPKAAPPESVGFLATYDVTAADQLASFHDPDAMDRMVDHPASPMPGSLLLMFRSSDLAIHAMDLANALGEDPTIDPELAESLWLRTEPLAPLLAASGLFGSPPAEIPAELAAIDKLLLASGR